MTDSARSDFTLASVPPVTSRSLGASVQHWSSAVLVIVALSLLGSVLLVYQNARPDTPILEQSTMGQLALWMAGQSGEEAPVSWLGQIARQQAVAQGVDRLDEAVVIGWMQTLLVTFTALLMVAGVAGLAGVLMNKQWGGLLLALTLLGMILLLFIIPPRVDAFTLPNLMLGMAALIVAILLGRRHLSKLVAFITLLASIVLVWQSLKAFGNATGYHIALPEAAWSVQTYESVDLALQAVADGTVPAAILDGDEVESLVGLASAEPNPAYPGLRILDDLNTDVRHLGFVIEPVLPGRLAVVARETDVNRWSGLSDLTGQTIGTYAGSFAYERYLAVPRELELVDLRITNDLNMPHLQSIAQALLQPARRNGELLLARILANAGLFTWSEAAFGFVVGALLGFGLGTLFAHSRLLERGLLPYVVASQTVPILAVAPMVVIWIGQAGIDMRVAVAVISAYLTFFPVTINTLRGLTSPNPMAIELMQSYAADQWTTLWKLRFPAALPYIFTALKVSATASVVGAIIGELPSGIRDGLGGAILNFNQYYTSDPAKLWASIFIAALVGIVFFMIVTIAERAVLGRRALAE